MEQYGSATAEMHVSISFNNGMVVALPPEEE